MKRFRIHPLLIVLLFGIFAYGNVSLYAALFSSLLIHEAGHLIVAALCGVKVKSCVLLPYGAEITLKEGQQIKPIHLLYIALGGPIATGSLAIVAFFLPPLYGEELLHIQLYLLLINLLPIWSLDGGRFVFANILLFYPYQKVYENFVTFSLVLTTLLFLISMFYLPNSISLAIICSFLWVEVMKEWRYRKYRSAFEKIVTNRLT